MIGGFIGIGIGLPLIDVEEIVAVLPPQKETIVRRRWLDRVRFDFVIKVE